MNASHYRVLRAALQLLAALSFFSRTTLAGEIVQKKGQATLRLEARRTEPGSITLALSDDIKVVISVEGKAGLEMNQAVTSLRQWHERRRSGVEKFALSGGMERLRQSFYLSPLEAGELRLEVTPLRYREPGQSQWQVAQWQPILCHVTTVITNPDLGQLRDITPPEELPAKSSPWPRVLLAVGALLLTSFVIGAVEYVRRRIAHRLSLSPNEWALLELNRLDKGSLVSRPEIEKFHIQLSGILRKYVELRFGFPAPARTTGEFIGLLGQISALAESERMAVANILQECDLVKFANTTQAAAECRLLSSRTRTWIKNTGQKRW